MGSWQRRARWILGTFVLIFGLVVFFAIGRRQDVSVPAGAVARLDPNAVAESTGAQVLRVSGSRQDYVVEMARQLTYADGRTRGEIVKVTVDERAGRSFVLRGREAEIAPNQTHVELRGDVQMEASDGLAVSTEHATYDSTGGLVRAPGPLQFSRGRMSGSGVGATWDQNRQVLWLIDQARIVIAGDGQGQGAVEIASGAAGLAQAEQYARFERGVRLVRQGQTAEAETAVAYLQGADNRVEMIELRGGSRIVGGGAAAGALERMTATDMNLLYAEDGQTLSRATLAGNAAVAMAAGAGAGRMVAADWLDIGFSPDGATVTSLAGRDGVQLDLPPGPDTPARQIRSTTLEATGAPGQGLTTARFEGQVEFREQRPAGRHGPAVSRVARARTLEAALRPGTGAIDEAHFSGGVIFEEGPMRATAPDARYAIGREDVELRTVAGGAAPRVVDGRTSIEARAIDLNLQTKDLVARDEVRTVLPGGPGGDVRRPVMLQADQDIFGTADHLQYLESTGKAVYTGGARLWQDDATISADTITLEQRSGNLTAKGSARSVWTLEQVNARTDVPDRVPTIGAADELVYEESARLATYLGHARVSGPQGDLHATRIELHLDPTGRELERVEAFEQVRLMAEDRRATGVRLTYFAADGRYVMGGTPVQIIEECRETTGKTLTFFRSTDTIIVDGNEERRTQTIAGRRCPEP